MDTISATVPVEDYRVQEEPIVDISTALNQRSEPELNEKQQVPITTEEPEETNALADNSTVVVKQVSAEPPTRPSLENLKQNLSSASNFKDQSRDMANQELDETNKESE